MPNPAHCPPRYQPLSWNQTGPVGPQGPVGPTGPQDPPGAPGFTLKTDPIDVGSTICPAGGQALVIEKFDRSEQRQQMRPGRPTRWALLVMMVDHHYG